MISKLYNKIKYRGVPVNKGCCTPVIKWLMPTLLIYGSIGIAYSAGELVIFILAVSICCAEEVGELLLIEEDKFSVLDPYRTTYVDQEVDKDCLRDKELKEKLKQAYELQLKR